MIYPGAPVGEATSTKDRERRAAAFRAWCVQEDERIRRQRLFLSRIGGEVQKELVRAMLLRAWDLLDAGEVEAADALLEFVPEGDARELLDAFFPDFA